MLSDGRDLGDARVVAVDWTGRVRGVARALWRCDVRAGAVVRLEPAPSREALVDALAAEHADGDRALAVGLDFAFSMPAWVFARTGFDSAPELWSLAASRGDAWLDGPRWPFWRAARPPDLPEPFRGTEREAGAAAGRMPTSIFQLVGAAQVGAGSVRGMALLPRLRAAGMRVWPFDDPVPDATTVVEIWPRLCQRARVTKSSAAGRAAYLDAHHPALDAAVRADAARSDDAFDALVAALAMWARRGALAALPPARDAVERVEGRIWIPAADDDQAATAADSASSTARGGPAGASSAANRSGGSGRA